MPVSVWWRSRLGFWAMCWWRPPENGSARQVFSDGREAARFSFFTLQASQTQRSRTANTCANLLRMWLALWTFLRNPLVPPTNNAAERALRDYVIQRKFVLHPL